MIGTIVEPPLQFAALCQAVNHWQRFTFPHATNRSVVKHLQKEVAELADSHAASQAADCLLLLMAHADREGYDLLEATRRKFREVQARSWGRPDADGVAEHVRSETEPPASDEIREWEVALIGTKCEFANRYRGRGGELIEPPEEHFFRLRATHADAMRFYRLLNCLVSRCEVREIPPK